MIVESYCITCNRKVVIIKKDKNFYCSQCKDKIKPPNNWWMIDDNFLNYSPYPNKYYLKEVCKHVYNFIRKLPLKVVTSLDNKNFKIYFIVGNNKKGFSIDDSIYYEDYLNRIKKWLEIFYPQYEVEIEKDVCLTNTEIWNKVKSEGISFDDACGRVKTIKEIERGRIIRVDLHQDQFIFELNGSKTIRISGTIDKSMFLSYFLEQIRLLDSDYEIRDFILNNSTPFKVLNNIEKEKIIDYTGKMMKSFIINNFEDNKHHDLIKKSDLHYEWGQYILYFQSEILEYDCIKLYNRLKKKGQQKWKK